MLYDSLGDEAGSARGMDVATFEDLQIDRLGEDLSAGPMINVLPSSAPCVFGRARTLYEERRRNPRALAAFSVRAPKA